MNDHRYMYPRVVELKGPRTTATSRATPTRPAPPVGSGNAADEARAPLRSGG